MNKTALQLFTLFILLLVTSCVPSAPTSARKSSVAATIPTTTAPSFSSSIAYFQSGGETSSSNLALPQSFNDAIYLRGATVHSQITNSSKTNVNCLMVAFKNPSNSIELLLMALKPLSFYNFSQKTTEYYYLLTPSESATNKTFCNKPAISAALTALYPTHTKYYSLAELCPSCSTGLLLNSSKLLPLSSAGNPLALSTTHLSLNVTSGHTSTQPVGLTCTTTSECKNLGLDCCVSGQCVKDKTVKDITDQSSAEYLQSVADILQNPTLIYNYPHLYNLCTSDVVVTPTPTPAVDPEEERSKFLDNQRDLYTCTTPLDGEMGICSSIYENIATLTTGSTYTTDKTDLSFRDIHTVLAPAATMPTHSIVEVKYGQMTLTEGIDYAISGGNFSLIDKTTITLLRDISLPSAATYKDLRIRFKTDVSCKRLNTTYAKCFKEYEQGKYSTTTPSVRDHYTSSINADIYKLPSYALSSQTITVSLDGVTKVRDSHWEYLAGPHAISFMGVGQDTFDRQKIKIQFYANAATTLGASESAINAIKTECSCADNTCRLEPVTNTSNEVISYKCVYPLPTTPLLQKTFYLSSKNIPMRFFDKDSGVNYTTLNSTTPQQEGTEFKYTGNQYTAPNNVGSYIGFQEVYGSMNPTSNSPKPPVEIDVQMGRTYDIYTDTGSFSTCVNCGKDYFSSLAKLFPATFNLKGGGYVPDMTITNPVKSSTYRMSDLQFGRACFLPLTMIPWTHIPKDSQQSQRLARLGAQHFLFANGYNKDWFGFDYGSVIGSFDGVTWFSIGSSRRIKATSNKLYIAVNAYFADLTSASSYQMTISDATGVAPLPGSVTTNLASDGAQCQQAHQCSKDQDCVTQLGWDYKCESIAGIKSNWPQFDAYGNEVTNASSVISLYEKFGSGAGSVKRCVYRGRGAPCQTNYTSVDETTSYSQTDKNSFHICSANNYCSSTTNATFNQKISRFGTTVSAQNSAGVWSSDASTFGLGAPLLGRPFTHNGTELPPTGVRTTLSNNFVTALCIPGRTPYSISAANVVDLDPVVNHRTTPSVDYLGDLILGIGMTQVSDTNKNQLTVCPTLNSGGELIHFSEETTTKASILALSPDSAAENISSNALKAFTPVTDLVTSDTSALSTMIYQENRCLRAPGAACFSDLDCGPSSFVTSKLAQLTSSDMAGILSSAELEFWQSTLVCGQAKEKSDPLYALKNNRCCRETNKTIKIATQVDATLSTLGTPSVDKKLSDTDRYSRFTPIKREQLTAATASSYPALQASPTLSDYEDLAYQFNTFAKTAERTCCSGNFIREFHLDNGGGHTWSAAKMQSLDTTQLKCYNWSPMTGGTLPFTCAGLDSYEDPSCQIRNLNYDASKKAILNWIGSFELTGIPQATILDPENSSAAINSIFSCAVDPDTQLTAAPNTYPTSDFITTGFGSYTDVDSNEYIAGTDTTSLSKLKQIFSSDTISCCIPAGESVAPGSDPQKCCTGFINQQSGKCALKDYTNISVYFNRYVSSAAKGISENLIDPKTGFIKDPLQVEKLACIQDVCASGILGRGVLLSKLAVPGLEGDDEAMTLRFLDGNTAANKKTGHYQLFKLGIVNNEHLYCLPSDPKAAGLQDESYKVIDCKALGY